MKKSLVFIAAILIAVVTTNAQSSKQTKGNTETKTQTIVKVSEDLLFLEETEFNFGKIPQGKPVTHTFEVFNKGKDSLKISNVQASCGCTTPEWERNKAIAPEGSAKITVGYNAAAEGTFAKTITITYNDNQTKIITIKGEVWKTPASSAPENKALNDF